MKIGNYDIDNIQLMEYTVIIKQIRSFMKNPESVRPIIMMMLDKQRQNKHNEIIKSIGITRKSKEYKDFELALLNYLDQKVLVD